MSADDQSSVQPEALVRVRDLSVSVGQKRLLCDINFDAYAGEVTGLIGPNGAGKSTLLAALSGDLERQSGSIDICGLDPVDSSARELARVRSVMLQDVSVTFQFLVRDVVAMGRRPWEGTDRQEFDDRLIDAALSATDAAHLAGRDIVTLSGGERARVALSRVLAQQTPVVMLDEPTAALDTSHQEQVLGLMQSIARRTGIAVIVVLHDLNAAAAYCDHIVCLADGRIVADGSVADVYTDETLSSVYGWPIHVDVSEGIVNSVQPLRGRTTQNQDDFVGLSLQSLV